MTTNIVTMRPSTAATATEERLARRRNLFTAMVKPAKTYKYTEEKLAALGAVVKAARFIEPEHLLVLASGLQRMNTSSEFDAEVQQRVALAVQALVGDWSLVKAFQAAADTERPSEVSPGELALWGRL